MRDAGFSSRIRMHIPGLMVLLMIVCSCMSLLPAAGAMATVRALINSEHQPIPGAVFQIAGDENEFRDAVIRGLKAMRAGNVKKAEEKLTHATRLQPGHPGGWSALGRLYLHTGQRDKAASAFERVLAVGEATNHQQAIALATGNLGLIYRGRGEFGRAEAMHLKAIAAYEQMGKQKDVAIALSNLALVYQVQQQYDRATVVMKKVLKIHQALDNKHGIAALLGNLAVNSRESGDLGMAANYHRQALKVWREIDDAGGLGIEFFNLGIVVDMQGDRMGACRYWSVARDQFTKAGRTRLIGVAGKHMSSKSCAALQ